MSILRRAGLYVEYMIIKQWHAKAVAWLMARRARKLVPELVMAAGGGKRKLTDDELRAVVLQAFGQAMASFRGDLPDAVLHGYARTLDEI
jgi:hypothetical protein